jgi:UDP-N-acetylmuramoyl-L-alanyl-D-glutamate--2,6-diaminopimelate ligase
MKLSQLFSVYPQVYFGESAQLEVSCLCRDSREVRPGSVFVAVPGHQADGHEYLEAAIANGAIALVVVDRTKVPPDFKGAVVKVDDARAALHRLASHFYGNPASQLFCVGVTGTNGKTTTTYMIEKILSDYGWKTGVMGTIDHHIGDHHWKSNLTTPDALELQKRLHEFLALGARAAVFEVSSHALSQYRVDEIPFDAAVFSNLTRDHLDYHGTMENYFKSKERLFLELLATSTKDECFAIINLADTWGARIQVADRAQTITYGTETSDLRFQILLQNFEGSRVRVESPRGHGEFHLPIPGLFNVLNALAAVGVGLAAQISLAATLESLSQFQGVPGRLQRVVLKDGPTVFVDYAHTPDALDKVLNELNQVRALAQSQGRILTVFGCGGDRDKGKRPLMGAIAERLSDQVFVTSDNPRTENPQAIVDDIMVGIKNRSAKVVIELDRRSAIGQALQTAQHGDVILVAGKGHENYQIVGKDVLSFDDVLVVQEQFAAMT